MANPGNGTTRDRENYWGPAVTAFCAAIGKPLPAPLTHAEKAAFEAEMDRADAAVAVRYGLGYAPAA